MSTMIDWDRVAELRNDFGEDDFLEIVELFLAEVEEKLNSLPEQPEGSLSEDFHFLKGSAANLGFRAFQSLCSKNEKAPDPNAVPEIQNLFQLSKETFLAGVNEQKEPA